MTKGTMGKSTCAINPSINGHSGNKCSSAPMTNDVVTVVDTNNA